VKTKILPCIRCRATWTVLLSHRRSFRSSNSTSLSVLQYSLVQVTAGRGVSSGMVLEAVLSFPFLLLDGSHQSCLLQRFLARLVRLAFPVPARGLAAGVHDS